MRSVENTEIKSSINTSCIKYKNFHKYENYKSMYAARKLGGGVVLTQIHEIDYLMDLFENYEINILRKWQKISNLSLDVEDTLLHQLN